MSSNHSETDGMEFTEGVPPAVEETGTSSNVSKVVKETTAAALRAIIADLSQQLTRLRQEASSKEKIAQDAKKEIKEIEDQLRALLNESSTSTEETIRAPSVVTAGPSAVVAQTVKQSSVDQQQSGKELVGGAGRWIEKGKCKFACGSTTHQFASDCDVYPTLSDRRDRMRELKLCFNQLLGSCMRVTEHQIFGRVIHEGYSLPAS
ncbi:hypothetical protein COOONC_21266 [Cooperia oncophora]